MTTQELLGITSGLVTILIALLAWIGSNIASELKKIAGSVNRIEKDLSVLSNDHANLKEDVKEIKARVSYLEG